MYDGGSEGPQWWAPWEDTVRGLPAAGILDRCTASQTCPKIIEHLGAAEALALTLSPGLVGTTAAEDIPLPSNVRRYYIPGTRHGGGRGGFSVTPLDAPACPGPGFGRGTFADNPVPHTETVNALREHFRNWVMHDTSPPPSQYPTIAERYLVDPTKMAMGFPTIPGVPVVLRDAPLGTYLGWNVVSDGFHKGKIRNYAGGMIPFAGTRVQRLASGDPRLSLEERYTSHVGYVEAVKAATATVLAQGFLLQADADALVAQAAAGNVLRPAQTTTARAGR